MRAYFPCDCTPSPGSSSRAADQHVGPLRSILAAYPAPSAALRAPSPAFEDYERIVVTFVAWTRHTVYSAQEKLACARGDRLRLLAALAAFRARTQTSPLTLMAAAHAVDKDLATISAALAEWRAAAQRRRGGRLRADLLRREFALRLRRGSAIDDGPRELALRRALRRWWFGALRTPSFHEQALAALHFNGRRTARAFECLRAAAALRRPVARAPRLRAALAAWIGVARRHGAASAGAWRAQLRRGRALLARWRVHGSVLQRLNAAAAAADDALGGERRRRALLRAVGLWTSAWLATSRLLSARYHFESRAVAGAWTRWTAPRLREAAREAAAAREVAAAARRRRARQAMATAVRTLREGAVGRRLSTAADAWRRSAVPVPAPSSEIGRLAALGGSLRRWATNCAGELGDWRRKERWLRTQWLRRCAWRGLRVWRAATAAAHGRRRTLVRATARWSRRREAAALRAWREFAARRVLAWRAAATLRHRTRRLALNGWRDALGRRSDALALLGRAAVAIRHRRQWAGLNTWQAAVAERHALPTDARLRLALRRFVRAVAIRRDTSMDARGGLCASLAATCGGASSAPPSSASASALLPPPPPPPSPAAWMPCASPPCGESCARRLRLCGAAVPHGRRLAPLWSAGGVGGWRRRHLRGGGGGTRRRRWRASLCSLGSIPPTSCSGS